MSTYIHTHAYAQAHTYAYIQHMHAQWPDTNTHTHMYTYALHSPSMPMMNTSPQTVPMHLYGLVGHAICIRASAMYVRTITLVTGHAAMWPRPAVD